jgi:hypothetical protein
LDAARRRTLLRTAGFVIAGVIVVRVGFQLTDGLRKLGTIESHPRWGMVMLSGAVFLIAHAVLVQTWRSVLSCWDEHLPFWSAARVWSVSNLGRYLPGKIWQIGAMGAMARELNVSPVAAAGSALLGTLVNIIAGFVVALVSGRALLSNAATGVGPIRIAIIIAASAGLLLAPFIVPHLAPLVSRVLKRPIEATLPPRAVVYALIGNVIAWLVYGAAFQLFVIGMLGRAAGDYSSYLAAYTISYLVGYIFLFAPAGVGFREAAMLEILQRAGLALAPEAALVTLSSRIWLTLLEVTPAVVFWAHHRSRRRSLTTDPSDVPT